jgi:hypothetical protein
MIASKVDLLTAIQRNDAALCVPKRECINVNVSRCYVTTTSRPHMDRASPHSNRRSIVSKHGHTPPVLHSTA